MALPTRICLLAFCLLLVLPVTGALADGAPALETVVSPARLSGAVPLTAPDRPKRAAPSFGQRAVRLAAEEIGVRYVYGGSSPSGFDCSGLVAYVYGRLGVQLPHNAAAQYSATARISKADLQPGDLVFYRSLGHVALYVGDGKIIDAPSAGRDVLYRSINIMTPYGYGRVK